MLWSGATATFGHIDLAGRFTPRVTIDDPAGRGVRAALAPDRERLAATVSRPGWPAGREARLLLVDLVRGASHSLIDGIDARSRPLWSPDGSEVAVRRVRATAEGDSEEVIAVAVATGEARPLAAAAGALGIVAVSWSAEGVQVLRVARDGSWLGEAGAPGEQVSGGAVRDVSLSPDGRWLAFSEYATGPTLGLLGPGGLTRLPLGGPFVHPAWRPDGTLIVAGEPGREAAPLAFAPVPVVRAPAAAGTVSLPVVVGRTGWLAARTVRLAPTGAVLDEWLDLIGPDGRRQAVRLSGYAEALGWVGE
jgi:dipeptidyl aminopeptidase/acylaminoacyl peptidase